MKMVKKVKSTLKYYWAEKDEAFDFFLSINHLPTFKMFYLFSIHGESEKMVKAFNRC